LTDESDARRVSIEKMGAFSSDPMKSVVDIVQYFRELSLWSETVVDCDDDEARCKEDFKFVCRQHRSTTKYKGSAMNPKDDWTKACFPGTVHICLDFVLGTPLIDKSDPGWRIWFALRWQNTLWLRASRDAQNRPD
jgi:hypothetical protein